MVFGWCQGKQENVDMTFYFIVISEPNIFWKEIGCVENKYEDYLQKMFRIILVDSLLWLPQFWKIVLG